jgi:hypothetical protein
MADTNGSLPARRWQPRAEWRDDLPLLDPRLERPEDDGTIDDAELIDLLDPQLELEPPATEADSI